MRAGEQQAQIEKLEKLEARLTELKAQDFSHLPPASISVMRHGTQILIDDIESRLAALRREQLAQK